MSTVAPSTSPNATGSAASPNGARQGLKAPSNQLHGSQANFAALLFQADEVAEEASVPQWLTDSAEASATEAQGDESTHAAVSPAQGDPLAFMNWIGIQPTNTPGQGQMATGTPGQTAQVLQSAGLRNGVTSDKALAEPLKGDAPAAQKPNGLTLTAASAPGSSVTPQSTSIPVALPSSETSEKGQFNQEKGMLTAPAESGSTGPKTRINSVRTSPAGMAALSNAPTSTVRLAAQHSVGMASSAPATTSLATLPGQMASSAQDSDRVAASRTAGSFDFLAETASLEGSSLGEALSTGAGSSSSNHESGAGNSRHDEGSLSWGGIGTDGLSQANQLESTEAAANAFQEQMSELTQQMEQWFAQGTQSASLTLDADGAMPVDIEVTLDNGKVSIRFGSDEEGAREALMGSIEASLKPLLEQHGMSLADVQVTPGSGQEAQLSQQMAQNQQGNRSPQQEPQARTSRTGPSHSVAAASTASTPTTARPTRQPQGVVDLFA